MTGEPKIPSPHRQPETGDVVRGPLVQAATEQAVLAIDALFAQPEAPDTITGSDLIALLKTDPIPLYMAIQELSLVSDNVKPRSAIESTPTQYLNSKRVAYDRLTVLTINQHPYIRTSSLNSIAKIVKVGGGIVGLAAEELGIDAVLPRPRNKAGAYGAKSGYYDLDQAAAIVAHLTPKGGQPPTVEPGVIAEPTYDAAGPDDLSYKKVLRVLGNVGMSCSEIEALFDQGSITDLPQRKVNPRSGDVGTYLSKAAVLEIVRSRLLKRT